MAVEDDVAVRLFLRIERGIGNHFDRAIAAIPEGFSVVARLGEGPGILRRRALGPINEHDAIADSVLESAVTKRALLRRGGLGHRSPLLFTQFEPECRLAG